MLQANRTRILWIISALCILAPFLYLGWHGVAASDDYYDYKLLQEKGFFDSIAHYYQSWSGRYISFALAFLLNPLHLGEGLGPAVTNTLSLSLLCSMAYFQARIYAALFLKTVQAVIPVTVIFLCFWLMYLPRPVEILFWFTGSMAYLVGPFLITMWVWLHIESPKTYLVQRGMYLVFPLLIAGGSEINILLMTFIMLLCIPKQKSELMLFLAPAILFLLGASIELLAPGNQGRMGYFEGINPAGDFQFSLTNSIEISWHILRDWTRSTPLLLLALLCTLLAKPSKQIVISNWQKLVLTGFAVLIPLLYFPFFWGTGMKQAPDRLHDYVFLVVSTGVIFLFPLIMQRFLKNIRIPQEVILVAFIIILWQGSYTSRLRTALFDIETLPAFNKEIELRNELLLLQFLKSNTEDTLYLPEIKHIPYTIFYGDLKPDAGHWYNEGYSFFHHVGPVVCLPEEEYVVKKSRRELDNSGDIRN
jgi:hypothetical protein